MNALVVRSHRHAVQVRGHELIVDQPTNAGGTDLELTDATFVAPL